ALVAIYYWAKSGIPTLPPAPTPPPVVLPTGGPASAATTATPTPGDRLAPLLTPPGADRAPDGRYISAAGPLVIPDNNRRGAVSHIQVPDHVTVGAVQVLNIRLTHPDTGELTVKLLAPDLTVETLLTHPCASYRDWVALSLSDTAYKLL